MEPTLPPQQLQRDRLLEIVFLLLITGAGAVWRWETVGESLWVDELHTAWVIADGLGEIPWRAESGNTTPLYFYLPWGVAQLGGLREWSVRLPSLLAGIALIPAAGVLVRRMTGSLAAGLMVALLVAVDANFRFFSVEARPYALVQLLGLAHVAIFWRLLDDPARWRRWTWIVLTVLLFYVHYTTLLLVVGEAAAWLLLWAWPSQRPAWRAPQALVDVAIAAVCCLPTAPHLLEVAARRQNWAGFVRQQPLLILLFVFPLGVAVLLPMAIRIVTLLVETLRGRRDQVPKIPPRQLVLVLCWLVVPLLLVWGATQSDAARLLLRRYVMASALAPMVLGGLFVAALPGKVCRAIAAGAVMLTSLWLAWPGLGWSEPQRRVGEDWRGVAQAINQSDAPSDWPVLVASGLIEADGLPRAPFISQAETDEPAGESAGEPDFEAKRLRAYCLLPVTGIYRLEPAERLLVPLPYTRPGQVGGRVLTALGDHQGCWLIVRGPDDTTRQTRDELLAALASAGRPVSGAQRVRMSGVGLWRLSLAAPAPNGSAQESNTAPPRASATEP